MIVQCSECSTRFKLDDSKVTESGIRVRCSKCKHVFTVRKESPPEEADLDSFLSSLGGDETPASTPEPKPSPAAPSAPAAAQDSAPADDEFSFDFSTDTTPAAAPPAGHEPEHSDSFGDFSFDEGSHSKPELGTPDTQPPAQQANDEFSFDDFPAPEEETAAAPEPPTADDAFSFDFSSPPAAADEVPKSKESSFEEDFSFEETVAPKPGIASPPTHPAASDEFDLGLPSAPSAEETDAFSFETAVSQQQDELAPPVEPKPGKDSFDLDFVSSEKESIPPAAPTPSFSFEAPAPATDMAFEDEPPALSPASRRQQTPGIKRILTAVLILLILGGGGYYLTNLGPGELGKLGLSELSQKLGLGKEEIRLELKNVKGAYIHNAEAGDLFVVRGEVFNGGNRTRTGIQVKASVYGKGGAEVAGRTAYCGNPLSDSQVSSMPFKEMEKSMNDQFGKSLANLGLEPQKSIPFTVVLPSVPAEAVQFGAEIAASAPSGK